MADPAKIIEKVRARGANIMIDGRKLVVINKDKLPADAVDFIRRNAKPIAEFLEKEAAFEERAAIIEFDGGLTRHAAEYLTHLLLASQPADVEPADWTWFVGKVTKIIEGTSLRSAA